MWYITFQQCLEKLLKEAAERLDEVRSKLLQKMAKELSNVDQYYYIKSYDWAVEGNIILNKNL